MNKENKSLLIKDLSARLQCNVQILADIDKTFEGGVVSTLKVINLKKDWIELQSVLTPFKFDEIKPYLRPMSSMTEEEKKELKKLFDAEEVTSDSICFLEGGTLEEYVSQIGYSFCAELIDWLNCYHFDYRGLIEKGLAIEVTKENNPYEN